MASLDILPDELLLTIFQFAISDPITFGNVQRCCHRFQDIACSKNSLQPILEKWMNSAEPIAEEQEQLLSQLQNFVFHRNVVDYCTYKSLEFELATLPDLFRAHFQIYDSNIPGGPILVAFLYKHYCCIYIVDADGNDEYPIHTQPSIVFDLRNYQKPLKMDLAHVPGSDSIDIVFLFESKVAGARVTPPASRTPLLDESKAPLRPFPLPFPANQTAMLHTSYGKLYVMKNDGTLCVFDSESTHLLHQIRVTDFFPTAVFSNTADGTIWMAQTRMYFKRCSSYGAVLDDRGVPFAYSAQDNTFIQLPLPADLQRPEGEESAAFVRLENIRVFGNHIVAWGGRSMFTESEASHLFQRSALIDGYRGGAIEAEEIREFISNIPDRFKDPQPSISHCAVVVWTKKSRKRYGEEEVKTQEFECMFYKKYEHAILAHVDSHYIHVLFHPYADSTDKDGSPVKIHFNRLCIDTFDVHTGQFLMRNCSEEHISEFNAIDQDYIQILCGDSGKLITYMSPFDPAAVYMLSVRELSFGWPLKSEEDEEESQETIEARVSRARMLKASHSAAESDVICTRVAL